MSDTTIKLKRSAVPGKVPTTGQLELGEVAINTHDGKMFFKRDENGNAAIREVGLADVAANTLYVSKSGVPGNNGTTIAEAFLTIDSALAAADSDTTVFIKSGDYTVNNPLVIPREVALVGDNLRTTTIRPQNVDSDIFWINRGCYVTGVTFRDHQNGAAAIAFPPDGSAGVITTSPYIQNCSSITTTGKGMYIDGSVVSGLRSMVSDAYTQYNSGGVGVHVDNRGYAQLVSIFTVATQDGFLATNGGQASITNSNSSFGTYGLRSAGVSQELYNATLDSDKIIGQTIITLSNGTQRPNYNDAILFDSDNYYYTVLDAAVVDSDTSRITIEPALRVNLRAAQNISFFQRSLLTTSGHTFEYVGAGTNVFTAIPQAGGIPIQANEVVYDSANNAGLVFFTSTDQRGDFRIGGALTINRQDGTITGTTFDRSLFAVLTPYILALED
jgi:hypothetical protein